MTVADVLLWWFGMIMAAAVVLAVFIGAVCLYFGWVMDWLARRRRPKPWVSDAQLDRWIADGEKLWDKPV